MRAVASPPRRSARLQRLAAHALTIGRWRVPASPETAQFCEDAPPTMRDVGKRSQVLENLVRTRPLARRDDDVDVAVSATIQSMIGDARRVYPERSQLIAPGDGGTLIFKRADGLPPVKPRIANRHRRVFGRTTEEAKTTHPHEGTPACASVALLGCCDVDERLLHDQEVTAREASRECSARSRPMTSWHQAFRWPALRLVRLRLQRESVGVVCPPRCGSVRSVWRCARIHPKAAAVKSGETPAGRSQVQIPSRRPAVKPYPSLGPGHRWWRRRTAPTRPGAPGMIARQRSRRTPAPLGQRDARSDP